MLLSLAQARASRNSVCLGSCAYLVSPREWQLGSRQLFKSRCMPQRIGCGRNRGVPLVGWSMGYVADLAHTLNIDLSGYRASRKAVESSAQAVLAVTDFLLYMGKQSPRIL